MSGEFGALLVTEMLPVALPAVEGENCAVNVVLWPGLNVTADSPLMLYPVPEADPPEIATLDAPPLVSVIVCELLLPT
jgi:hypothetical protein